MGAGARALVVETIAKIGRAYFVQKKPIKAICREFRLSRTVVRKVIRSSGLRLPGFIASVAGNHCHGLIRGGRSLTGCYSQTRASRRASGLCCPRRTRIPALRADRRTAPVSSDQPGLRANLGHCHHQSRFWRMARRLWRRQDDDGTPRPADPFLRNHRNRQRELALQAPRLSATPACPGGQTGTSHARRSVAREGTARRARDPPVRYRDKPIPTPVRGPFSMPIQGPDCVPFDTPMKRYLAVA